MTSAAMRGPTIQAPRHSTLALSCSTHCRATCVSWQTAARIVGTLFAAVTSCVIRKVNFLGVVRSKVNEAPCSAGPLNLPDNREGQNGLISKDVMLYSTSSGRRCVHSGHRTSPHWSGRRDSNPRPSPWQGDALPTEPRPRKGYTLAVGHRGSRSHHGRPSPGASIADLHRGHSVRPSSSNVATRPTQGVLHATRAPADPCGWPRRPGRPASPPCPGRSPRRRGPDPSTPARRRTSCPGRRTP